MLCKGQCHFPLHQDSLSIAGEIIDPKLLQSQPIEKWDGDVSSCWGRKASRLGSKCSKQGADMETRGGRQVGILGKLEFHTHTYTKEASKT